MLAKDRDLLDRATELRLHADRRIGELFKEMEERGEKAKKGGDRRSKSPTSTMNLKDLGVTRDEAACAKKLSERRWRIRT